MTVDDSKAIIEIISLWRRYREDNLRVDQPYAFRGIDDPKYSEIREAYDIAIARRDVSLSLFVIAINEYIDSRGLINILIIRLKKWLTKN